MVTCLSLRGVRPRVGDVSFEDKSLAVQASKEECDINNIIKRYMRTGELPGLRQAIYADISEIKDLKSSLDDAYAAQEAFMALPAEIRRRFDNDPVKLVEFSMDNKNYDEAVKLGLVIDKRPPSRQPPPPVGQTGSPPEGQGSK